MAAFDPATRQKAEVQKCDNWINGSMVPPNSGKYLDVIGAVNDEKIGEVAVSDASDVDAAVAVAKSVFPKWSGLTIKARAAIMFKFHALLEEHTEELVELIMLENGKNRTEAGGDIAKGNETVEWSCSLPQLLTGKHEYVSRGLTCHEVKEPIGIVASIVPFNFPLMVPMWTTPIALACGNCVILKPSEKVPLTMNRVSALMKQAGVPDGVFQIVNGQIDTVNALCDHPDIAGLTFVGSSKVAQIVARRCRAIDKKCICLGGAKNHLVVLPDCDPEMAATDIMVSFAGSAGQRCMAASVLICVGDCSDAVEILKKKTAAVTPGQGVGQVSTVIDAQSKEKILRYINEAEKGGAKILVDGRSWAERSPGNWVGPTIIMHSSKDDPLMKDEIFGPVLSVIQVETHEEALAIENANPHGNAACIYTSVGQYAEHFSLRFRAGMIGVNVGVPVPREPFSFGGLGGTMSKYGDHDITGDGCMQFMTNTRKITTKWARPAPGFGKVDKANFDGAI